MPATIAIIGGRIKIGLTREEIEYMATAENVLKVSRRDFPLTISQGLDGATTVAGTMIAAHMAGIRLFVTGGIAACTEAQAKALTSPPIWRNSK